MRHPAPHAQAFSLVELSIVLVVIGLITGSILYGQNLLRMAAIRSVVVDRDRFMAAATNFRTKYKALPGDFSTATSYWGTASGGCYSGARSDTQTCNGNNDGLVVSDNKMEHFLFWQHLGNAGFIESQYNGMPASGGYLYYTRGINVPASRISNVGWGIRGVNVMNASSTWFTGTYGNALTIGVLRGNNRNEDGAFTAEEAWGLDRKIDDGKPGIGKLIALNWATCTTAGAATDNFTATYAMTDKTEQCALIFPKAI